jgi:hydroxypyruvate isomerase
VSDSLAVSRQLGSPPLVVTSGFSREGVDIAEQQAQAVHILRQAATLAEAAGVPCCWSRSTPASIIRGCS